MHLMKEETLLNTSTFRNIRGGLQFIRKIAFSVFIMTRIADVIELVGSSDKSWQDAAQVALEEAKKTIRGDNKS